MIRFNCNFYFAKVYIYFLIAPLFSCFYINIWAISTLLHIDLYKIVKGLYTLAVPCDGCNWLRGSRKKAAWCNQSSLRILKLLLVFYFLSTDLNAFDFRSVHPAGVQTIYFSLPSPHIPIAALAANRVIIIVINITFYLKTIILTKF